MAEADRILAAQIGGTSRRVVSEELADADAIAILRDRAQGRVDLLRSEAAMAIGGWLGQPHTPEAIKSAYLLLMAAGVDASGGRDFVADVDAVRRRVEQDGHSTPK